MITTDEGRATRAKGMKIDFAGDDYLVHDPKKKKGYLVKKGVNGYQCPCGDKFKASYISCKHIVAVAMLEDVKIKVLK